MNRAGPKPALGLFAAFTPAIFGGFGLAYLLPSGNSVYLSAAAGLGILVGFTALALGRSRAWIHVAVAALLAVLGVAIALVLDIRWNSVLRLTRELAESHQGDMIAAEHTARTMLSAASFMDLAMERLRHAYYWMAFFAALGAVLSMRSRFTARLLRVPLTPNKDASNDEV